MTASSLELTDTTRDWVSSFVMLCQAFTAADFSCRLFVGLSAFSFVFSKWNAYSIGLRSGDWLGHCRIFLFFYHQKLLGRVCCITPFTLHVGPGKLTFTVKKYVQTVMKQRSGSSSLSTLKLRLFASLVKRNASHYTSHRNVTCLYWIFMWCVWTYTQIPENHWQCEWTTIKRSRDKSQDTLSVYFLEFLCERGLCFGSSFICTMKRYPINFAAFDWIWAESDTLQRDTLQNSSGCFCPLSRHH